MSANAGNLNAPGLDRLAGVDLALLETPSAAEYVVAYNARAARWPAANWDVYVVFNPFRLAAIVQGIAKRSLDGTAADPKAAALGRMARPIAETGRRLAEMLG